VIESRELIEKVAQELAAVLGALLDATPEIRPVEAEIEPGFSVRFGLSGNAGGHLTVAVGRRDLDQLTRRITKLEADPSDVVLNETLREVFGQVAAGFSQPATGVELRLDTVTPSTALPSSGAIAMEIAVAPDFAPRIACWIAPAGQEARAATPPQQPQQARPANLDVILDIDLPLAIRFGETKMTLAALTRVGPGSMIDLGRAPDEPVDVLVNGKLVARGEVVVVAGNYGIRVVEVMSTAERIRTLAG
jgi:flagellar motor switch protein FliN